MVEAPPTEADREPPHNYLPHAILTTIFCCTPFGIVAIVKGASVNSLWHSGQHAAARDASRAARRWGWISFFSAIAFWGVLIGVGAVTGAFDVPDEAECRRDATNIATAEDAFYATNGRFGAEEELTPLFLNQSSGLHDVVVNVERQGYRIVTTADGGCS